MKTSDYDYSLPKELIAQTPLENRVKSRLMVLNKRENTIRNDYFENILDYLNENDVLVLNDSKVYKARLIGLKEHTLAKVELLILDMKNDVCKCLTKPGKRVKVGTKVIFGDGLLTATCICALEDGVKEYKMDYVGIFYEVLDKLGTMPLPPYITEKLEDSNRYQTVYAKIIGSAAAPTAGLHFTESLLEKIKEKKVKICYVTLHVGLGTFRPVEVTDVSNHIMHSEYYIMSQETCNILNNAKSKNNKIICCGTTSCRVLESNIKNGLFVPEEKHTNIFIYEGYQFQAMDALITNFHLPKSTLIMLVSAFSNKDLILKAYTKAVEDKYRFFSFGDAMLIH